MVIGIGSGLLNPMVGTFLQITTPEQFMGRVMGLVRAGAMVAQPVGLLLGGAVIALFGFSTSILMIAGLMAVPAILLAISPAMRALDTTAPAKLPEIATSDAH